MSNLFLCGTPKVPCTQHAQKPFFFCSLLNWLGKSTVSCTKGKKNKKRTNSKNSLAGQGSGPLALTPAWNQAGGLQLTSSRNQREQPMKGMSSYEGIG